jgi:predicted transcriptional regulator
MRLTRAEWQLMNALWEKYPATARDICDALPPGTDWAYTTVKTMLSRLVAKSAIEERKVGNASLYEPLVTRRRARLAAIRSMAEEAFDGAFGTLVHFIVEQEKLSPAERRKLRELLQKESHKGDAK